jgi:hypothetical protein
MSDERDVSKRYRELPREEPPRALDDAILAASRRAVRSRPGMRRWYVPLATAATLVLVVGVGVLVEREQPGGIVVQQAPIPEMAKAPAPQAAEAPRQEQPRRAQAPAQAPFTPDPPAAEAPRAADAVGPAVAPAAPPAATRAERSETLGAASAAKESRDQRSSTRLSRSYADPTPENELERIAKLRADGRHEEADKALAEFRKRHPDYRIEPAMLERVEKK